MNKRRVLLACCIAFLTIASGTLYDMQRPGSAMACAIVAAVLLCVAPFLTEDPVK